MQPAILILMNLILVKGIFGVPVGFVLGFLIKLIMLFAASAIISRILHLERAYDHTDDPSGKNEQ